MKFKLISEKILITAIALLLLTIAGVVVIFISTSSHTQEVECFVFLTVALLLLLLLLFIFWKVKQSERDIERKKSEQFLYQLNAGLEQKVRERTEDLNKSEKRFVALLENNEGIISLLDEKANTFFRSSSSGRIAGWTNEEFEKNASIDYTHTDDVENVTSVITEALSSPGKPIPLSVRVKHKKGHYVWLDGVVTNMLNDKDINGIVVNLKDITKLKEAEQKIIKANRLYLFISQINQMIVRATDETTLFKEACHIAVNPGKFRMAWIGILNEKTKLLEPVIYDGIDMDYLSAIKIKADSTVPESSGPSGRALLDGRTVFSNDIETDPMMAPWRTEALKRNYLSSIAIPIKKSGKVIGAFTLYADSRNFFDTEEIALLEEATGNISFALDIFEKEILRKRAEEALLESKRSYQTLTEISPVGIFHTDETGYTTYVNLRWCDIAGINKEEALGNGWLNAVHIEDKEKLISGWTQASKDSKLSLSEYRFVHADGKISWVMGLAVPEKNAQNEVVGFVGTITDITELKIAEEKIKESKEKYRNLVERVSDAFVALDKDWVYTFVNKRAGEIFGRKPEQLIGKNIWTEFPEGVGQPFHHAYEKAMKEQVQITLSEYYPPYDKWFENDIYPSPEGLSIYFKDITERKKAQDEIIRERNLSDSVINSLPGVFYLYNEEGKFLRWNKNFETVTKYSADEIRKMHPLDFYDTIDKNLLKQKIGNVFSSGEDYVQASFLLKTKEKIPYYFTGIKVEYEGNPCLIGVGIDFSERVKAQEKINEATNQLHHLTAHLQSIREEERKRIGREIHDELGQQLTAIKMDVAWIDKKIPDQTTAIKNKLKNIIGLLDGSNQSVRKILNELRPTALDNQGLLETMEWQSRQFTESTGIPVTFTTTEIAFKLPEEITTCIFRVYQESLTNIMCYARAKKVLSSLSINKSSIVLTIEDDGIGFEMAVLQNKKTFGILGMKERVRFLKGNFEQVSSPGNGTKISIRLPLEG